MSCSQIAKVLFLDDDTVRSLNKQYLPEDWEAVAYDGWKGGVKPMQKHFANAILNFMREVLPKEWLTSR